MTRSELLSAPHQLRAALIAALVSLSPAFGYAQSSPPHINGNCNNFGNNNFNCNQVIDPRRLELTDPLKELLLQDVPKDKPGEVNIIGPSPADREVGMDILNFLKANGYSVRLGYMAGFANPSPDYALTLHNTPNSRSWILDVAPSLPIGP